MRFALAMTDIPTDGCGRFPPSIVVIGWILARTVDARARETLEFGAGTGHLGLLLATGATAGPKCDRWRERGLEGSEHLGAGHVRSSGSRI